MKEGACGCAAIKRRREEREARGSCCERLRVIEALSLCSEEEEVEEVEAEEASKKESSE